MNIVARRVDEIESLKINIHSINMTLRDKVFLEEFIVYKNEVEQEYLKNDVLEDLNKRINKNADFEYVLALNNEILQLKRRLED